MNRSPSPVHLVIGQEALIGQPSRPASGLVRKGSMAAIIKALPYPSSPTNVPEGFTDFAASYIRQQNKLLVGMLLFLIFYIFLVTFSAMVGTWCLLAWTRHFPLKFIGMIISFIAFLFLLKGFFKRPPISKEKNIEITEEEHPLLFKFIEKLCDEIRAPLPQKVYLSPDVNAACIRRLSLINLVVEPKSELLIGLGLVNCLNLSEFKAVL